MRILSRQLVARSESVSDHPTAKGDQREQLLRDEITRAVGSAFAVRKAEVVDSTGRSSGEIDAVIYDQRVGACVSLGAGDRAVLRVENVAATIEMKSTLKREHLDALFQDECGFAYLQRYYRATSPLRLLLDLGMRSAPDRSVAGRKFLEEGLPTWASFESVPTVARLVVALAGPSIDVAAHYAWLPHVDAVCVVGKYTIGKSKLGLHENPPEVVLWAEDEDSLGAFFHLIETALERHLEAREWVTPDWRRYYAPPVAIAQPVDQDGSGAKVGGPPGSA